MRFLFALLLTITLSSCGPAADPTVFDERVFDQMDYEGSVTVRDSWRMKAFTTEEGLNVLVVSGVPEQEVTYVEIKSRDGKIDNRLREFTWNEGWQGDALLRNSNESIFDEVCDWLEDEGDWDENDDINISWNDSWVQGILKEENPYRRYENIHEVWVVDSEVKLDAVERDRIYFPQLFCMLSVSPMMIMFYPEHYETCDGSLRVRVYDTLNRRFRADKTVSVTKERSRAHYFWSNILGHATFSAFNFPPRTVLFWIPFYDTDSTPLIDDVVDAIESDDEFEDGIVDLLKNADATRPDTKPARLRIVSQKGYVDSSKVVTIPIKIKNEGGGSAWNVRVMITGNSQSLDGIVPEKVDVGDIEPGKSVDTQIRFRLPRDLRSNVLVLTLQPRDESPQKYRKTQVRVPLR